MEEEGDGYRRRLWWWWWWWEEGLPLSYMQSQPTPDDHQAEEGETVLLDGVTTITSSLKNRLRTLSPLLLHLHPAPLH